MDGSSKDYSWQYFTGSNVVATREAELVGVYLVPSAAAADVTIYNGQSNTGDIIAVVEEATKSTHEFEPPVPIYCRKGIYLVIGTNVTGCLVQWRNLTPEG